MLEAGTPAGRPARARRRRPWESAAALLAYAAVSFAYFGLPIAAHPGRELVARGTDADIFVWSFAWWAHALRHGVNPIVTHAIWAPDGIDLAWTATSPGLAVLFAPLTLLAGPVASYNTAAVLMPALGAWTAFLLCRYLTHSTWPSLAAGYLFGFSSYMVAHEQGHLHATSAFLVPLLALAALRRLDGLLGAPGLAAAVGVILAAQLWFSTELAATLTLALGASLAIGFAIAPSARRRIRALVLPLAAGYGIAAILASPLLYYALTDFQRGSVNPPGQYVADLVNVVVPTRLAALGGAWATDVSARFPGNEAEQVAYLGVPTLVILGLYFVGSWRRDRVARFLAVSFALALLAALGTALRVDGHRVAPMPWRLLAGLPVLNNVIPARLLLYALLAAAAGVALWAASSASPLWVRAGLTALAVLALVPDLGLSDWKRTPGLPAFFAYGQYRDCIRAGDNVLPIPYGPTGDALLWQAVSGFHFRMAGGLVSPAIPAGFAGTPVIRLINDDIRTGDGGTVLDLAHAKGVSTIVVDEHDPWPWRDVLTDAGRAESVGGMLLYPLEPGPATSLRCTSTQASPPPGG